MPRRIAKLKTTKETPLLLSQVATGIDLFLESHGIC